MQYSGEGDSPPTAGQPGVGNATRSSSDVEGHVGPTPRATSGHVQSEGDVGRVVQGGTGVQVEGTELDLALTQRTEVDCPNGPEQDMGVIEAEIHGTTEVDHDVTMAQVKCERSGDMSRKVPCQSTYGDYWPLEKRARYSLSRELPKGSEDLCDNTGYAPWDETDSE